MSKVRLKTDGPAKGAYAKDVMEWQKPMAKAATGAFRDAAKLIEGGGRAAIAAGGFSLRWQKGFRVTVTPKQASLKPTLRGRHTLGFANIFQTGGTIRGKPLLWIPLSGGPAKLGGKRLTPRLYASQIGPLHRINRPGKPPLLAGTALRPPVNGRATTVAQLRNGARHETAAKGQRRRKVYSVPVFVGVPVVKIHQRFDVARVYGQVHAQLGELYARRLEEGGGPA
jgi:hypothetical protein